MSIWAPLVVLFALIALREIIWRRGQTWRSRFIGPAVVLLQLVLFLGVVVVVIGGGISLVMILRNRPFTDQYFGDTVFWTVTITASYQLLHLIVVRGVLRANGFSWLDVANWRALLPHILYRFFPNLVDARRQEYVRLLLRQWNVQNREQGFRSYLTTVIEGIRQRLRILRALFPQREQGQLTLEQAEQLSQLALIKPLRSTSEENRSDGLSFLVIGDPGEGDRSQKALRKPQEAFINGKEPLGSKCLLIRQALAERGPGSFQKGKENPVDFLLISSDVIYPAGQMIDYEDNFYQPFRGWRQPILAIPGNHDWYDKLRGFSFNFINNQNPGSSNRNRPFGLSYILYGREWAAALRKKYDLGLLVGRADSTIRRRSESGSAKTPTEARQRNMFFEIAFEDIPFSVFAVDTGTGRQLDPIQEEWLKIRLRHASEKKHIIMAILGHPIYVNRRCGPEKGLRRLYRILRDHHVHIVMAGDTHNYQHYEVRHEGHVAHHIVNGGGGAFLGSTLNVEPGQLLPDTVYPGDDVRLCEVYPRAAQFQKKFSDWLEKLFLRLGATAMLNHDREPFYQSFVKVALTHKEGSAGWRLDLKLYGHKGRPQEWQTEYPAIRISQS